ncbi:MAG: geranylgeranylglycerol-phosphate geranylgeranyltransferase [Salibacteraceae bacterium]
MVITAYLKLIRLPILLLIAAIQYSVRYFIIEPMLRVNGFELIMTEVEFGYLVLATVLIAAGGYAINDYFDAKIDRVNKPKTVVLDRLVPRRVAMLLHIVLTSLGFLLAAYMSYMVGYWKLISLFLFAVFALWFYSTNLKHQLLIGNITIAVMAGFVPLIVGLYEIPMQNAAHPESIEELGFSVFNVQAYWIMGYAAVFAVLTLAREISKDIIDLRGDRLYGSNTVPIAWGIRSSKLLLLAIYFLVLVGISYMYVAVLSQHAWYLTALYFAVVGGLLIQPIIIYMAKTKRQFMYSVAINNGLTLLVLASMYLIKLSIESYFSL